MNYGFLCLVSRVVYRYKLSHFFSVFVVYFALINGVLTSAAQQFDVDNVMGNNQVDVLTGNALTEQQLQRHYNQYLQVIRPLLSELEPIRRRLINENQLVTPPTVFYMSPRGLLSALYISR